MSAPLYGLLYRSRATRGLLAADLSDILTSAVEHNEARDVTGLLVYGEMAMLPGIPGLFVQWLEGAEADVREVYGRIQDDPRHTDIELVAEGPQGDLTGENTRLFPAWGMALRRLADVPATLPGFLVYARQNS